MSDHPTSQLLARYQERVLPSAVFLEVHQHILSCVVCWEKCHASPQQLSEDYASLQAAVLSTPEDAPYHLSSVEAEAYVNKELDEIDFEIAESHLELCAACGDRVRQLHDARSDSAAGAFAPHPVKPKQAGRAGSRLTPFLWFNRLRLRHLVALSAAAIIFLTTLILVSIQKDERSKSPTIADRVNSNSDQNLWPQDGQSNFNQEATPNENTDSGTVGGNSTPLSNSPSSTSPARNVLVMNDNGRQVALDDSGNLSGVEDLPADLRQEIKEMLIAGKVRRQPASTEFDGTPGTLLSESAGDGLPFRLISPISKVIRDNRPIFRWQQLKGADNYIVTVADAQLDEVISSKPVSATAWKMQKPLKYGDTYSWQVTAIKGGEKITSPVLPAPQAKFKVLSYDKVRVLRQAEKAYAGSHLSLAVLYLRAGLFDEAKRELKILSQSNPQSSTARSLLRSLSR